nr:hypothetical protein [Tanacetum cinerariifolium]
MPLYESEMTAKDFKLLAIRHGIPLDLHPVALTKGWTMDQLPDDMIGLYEQYFEFSGIRIPFSTFLLAVIKHFHRHHDSDVNEPISKDGFNASDVQMLTERIVDLRHVPSGLLFQGGLATTWVFLAVTMYEYLRFPFLSSDFILKGPPLTPQDQIEQHITVAFRRTKPSGQRRIIKKGSRWRIIRLLPPGRGKPELLPRKERKRKEVSMRENVLAPFRAMGPTNLATENPSEAVAETAESRKDRSLYIPLHDSANRSVHDDRGVRDDEEMNSLRLGSFVDQSRRNSTLVQTEVFCAIISYIVALPLKKRPLLLGFPYEVLTLMKGSHPETKLTMCPSGPSAIDVAWIPLCGALAQTDILERFENLQADYDQLAETHSKCGETVKKLVQVRSDLEHNANLYIIMADRYKMVKSECDGCVRKLEVLENRNKELSQVNKDQALRIRELEDELARKDFSLVYAERINAERAQEKEKLVAQLRKTEMEKFDCIRKLLPTVAKGLAEERSEEDLSELMSRMEGFDAYSDKKMFVEYDKLFEKRYPFVENISRCFCHTVSDSLNIPTLLLLNELLPANPPLEKLPHPLFLISLRFIALSLLAFHTPVRITQTCLT